jgi:O-acetyl-ADP-ribose deacetylase (regulator of RNase III)
MKRHAQWLDANIHPELSCDGDQLLEKPLRRHPTRIRDKTPPRWWRLCVPENFSILTGMHRYLLGRASVELVQGDITRADTVAIANAANAMLMGGGGVDGAIHRAAGPRLMEALRELKRDLPGGVLETGGAVVTPGFDLAAQFVIHCAGPIYAREGQRAATLLARCYMRSLKLCRERKIASISFPSISTGVYGYPLEEAAPLALEAVRRGLVEQDVPGLVRFVLFDAPTLEAYRSAAERVFAGQRS